MKRSRPYCLCKWRNTELQSYLNGAECHKVCIRLLNSRVGTDASGELVPVAILNCGRLLVQYAILPLPAQEAHQARREQIVIPS